MMDSAFTQSTAQNETNERPPPPSTSKWVPPHLRAAQQENENAAGAAGDARGTNERLELKQSTFFYRRRRRARSSSSLNIVSGSVGEVFHRIIRHPTMAVASETTSTTSSDVARYSIASPSRDAFITGSPKSFTANSAATSLWVTKSNNPVAKHPPAQRAAHRFAQRPVERVSLVRSRRERTAHPQTRQFRPVRDRWKHIRRTSPRRSERNQPRRSRRPRRQRERRDEHLRRRRHEGVRDG